MVEGGTAIVALNRGWSRKLEREEGMVRWWSRGALEALMSRHGFEAEEWRVGEHLLLRGKKSA
jgi:hypothetical protein